MWGQQVKAIYKRRTQEILKISNGLWRRRGYLLVTCGLLACEALPPLRLPHLDDRRATRNVFSTSTRRKETPQLATEDINFMMASLSTPSLFVLKMADLAPFHSVADGASSLTIVQASSPN